jgi:hypothetical protein
MSYVRTRTKELLDHRFVGAKELRNFFELLQIDLDRGFNRAQSAVIARWAQKLFLERAKEWECDLDRDLS